MSIYQEKIIMNIFSVQKCNHYSIITKSIDRLKALKKSTSNLNDNEIKTLNSTFRNFFFLIYSANIMRTLLKNTLQEVLMKKKTL